MRAQYIYFRNQVIVWGRKNYDRLGRGLNLQSGEHEVFLENSNGHRLLLDMRYISPVAETALIKALNCAASVYQSKLTAYWGLYLPVRAKSAEDALRHVPSEARKMKSDYAPSLSLVKTLYMEHEDQGVVVNDVGRKVRTQSAAEYFSAVDRLAVPVFQVMNAFEKRIVPSLERNPLVAIEMNQSLTVGEMDILEQAIFSSENPLEAAKLALMRVSDLPDELAANLFLKQPDRDILKLLSESQHIRFTKSVIEQLMHTSRRPLLEFQVPTSWISVSTVVKMSHSISAHQDLILAEKYSRWKPVVNSQNRHIALCRDNIIDLIASLRQREEA